MTNEEALAAFPIQKLNKLEELISLIRYLPEPRDGYWIMYGMDRKFKLGDQLKNFRTIQKIWGFITLIAS